MPPQTPSLAEVLENAIEEHQAHTWIALPAKILEFDAAMNSASVQPLCKETYTRETGEHATTTLPVCQGVPVCFPGGGAFGLTWKPKAGDTGLLIFCSSSLDRWKTSTSTSPIATGDNRRQSLSDGVFLPGLRSFPAAKSAPAAKVDDEALVVHAPAIKLGSETAAQAVIRGDDFKTSLNSLLTALNTFAGTCVTSPTGTAGALATAVTTFQNAWSGVLSGEVKIR